jgi:ElaA protein
METVVKRFNELTPSELYGILKLRSEVFVVEQKCIYQDLDGRDEEAIHVFLKDESGVIACLRIVPAGALYDDVCIGRVVSVIRKKGHGGIIMRAGIEAAKEYFGAERIFISAQTHAVNFYSSFGFETVTEEYMDEGIPHVGMIYNA